MSKKPFVVNLSARINLTRFLFRVTRLFFSYDIGFVKCVSDFVFVPNFADTLKETYNTIKEVGSLLNKTLKPSHNWKSQVSLNIKNRSYLSLSLCEFIHITNIQGELKGVLPPWSSRGVIPSPPWVSALNGMVT